MRIVRPRNPGSSRAPWIDRVGSHMRPPSSRIASGFRSLSTRGARSIWATIGSLVPNLGLVEITKGSIPSLIPTKSNYQHGWLPTVSLRIPAAFTASESFDVGVDLGSTVSRDYCDRRPFRFDNRISNVLVELQ